MGDVIHIKFHTDLSEGVSHKLNQLVNEMCYRLERRYKRDLLKHARETGDWSAAKELGFKEGEPW